MIKFENAHTKTEDIYRITVIGLGLIGGSMAMALRGFKNALITGVDIDPEALRKALARGAIDTACEGIAEGVADADLVILCVSPNNIIKIVQENIGECKEGSIVTDVCGTKKLLYAEIEAFIPKHVEYIGIHPMAGNEIGGFDNASPELFKGTGFIIVPINRTQDRSLLLMEEVANHIGAINIARNSPELHDDIIAYTSDLMHISATALCIDYHPQMTKAYTAGAFRDCTRIANIDPQLWTDLLMHNREKIILHLDVYIENLLKMKKSMQQHDEEELYSLLEQAKICKKEMLNR